MLSCRSQGTFARLFVEFDIICLLFCKCSPLSRLSLDVSKSEMSYV